MATPYVVHKVASGYHQSELQPDLDCNPAKCRFSYAHWCPICEVRQNGRCGRRRSKSEGLEADPLREHNRPYETPPYQSHHWKRKIVKEYDLRNSPYQQSSYSIASRNSSELCFNFEERTWQTMDIDGNMENRAIRSNVASPIKKYKERLLPTPFQYHSKGYESISVAQNMSGGENSKHFVSSCDNSYSSDMMAGRGRHSNSPFHRKLHSDYHRKSSLVNSSSWTSNGDYQDYSSMPAGIPTRPNSCSSINMQQHYAYNRREMQGDGFLCPVGGSDNLYSRQPCSLSSDSMQEQYLHEVEVLRSKLRELRGGVDGKRLRQRSESEPGAGCSNGGGKQESSWEPKRARDISPNLPQDVSHAAAAPAPASQGGSSMQRYKGPSHRVHDAKLPHVPTKVKPGVPFSKVLPVAFNEEASLCSSDSDFADDDHTYGSAEDGDSKGEPGEDSEEDDHSVMSSLTTLSSDSNTPSVVGETLGSISLNDNKEQHNGSLPASDTAGKSKQFPSCLRASLFSHVPPYISFSMHDTKGEALPPDIARHLKWKLSTITPLVVRRTLVNSGFKLVRKSNDWCGTWGKHMKSMCFKTLKEFQKINHFPGTFQIGRKDRLWKNLYRLMTKFGKKEFGFIPRTFVLPQDSKLLRQAWEKSCGKEKWIIKPPASARGTGIKVINRWAQIPKKRPLVVQKYISEPYLINGSKFDLRLYVLVTSMNPLRIYLYDDGLVRFASVKYSSDMACLGDRYMHLTNYSINKLSSQYTQNEDASACMGHKWTVKSLWTYLEKDGVDVKGLWTSLVDLVIKTIISGESSINQLTRANLMSRYCSYELFGIDVLLDETLKPWLLEVNISPSLHSSSPLDLAVKGPMVRDLMNMAGYHIPSKLAASLHEELLNSYGVKDKVSSLCFDRRLYTTVLSKEERMKHSTFQNSPREEYLEDILRNLTPDDIRHLIQSEDELTQAGRFLRVFPTPETYVYHEFFESPRYYNLMFDAWETKYNHNRIEGIRLLELSCRQKAHLTVPSLSGPKLSASQPVLPLTEMNSAGWEDKNEEKNHPERKVLSLSSVALYRAARPRSGKPAVVVKTFPRSSYISRKPKSASLSPTTTRGIANLTSSDIPHEGNSAHSSPAHHCPETASCSC
ncbi:tubulin polyglutamylase ttll-4 isoform X2 [Anabrus simplex]|uniref:tubulin polyglutamylase ttll-4 isoform X2 n=1 Tax=Anabrus simplex TaxID=316456 RepID=UPI0035A2B0BC